MDYEKLVKILREIKPSVFIFHSYFGFDTCSKLEETIEKNVDWLMWTINDETQSMFINTKNDWTDFRIGSIRKWGPIPDGAYLFAKEEDFPVIEYEDRKFINGEIHALTMKQDYLEGKSISKELFQQKFAEGRRYIDNHRTTYSMSQESRYIFNRIIWEKSIEIRRENYFTLLNGLKFFEGIIIPIITESELIAPYEMPIYVEKNRKELQSFLAKNRVYATIIWSCPDGLKEMISEDERYIYDKILCLPCDQRYNQNDMKRIISLFIYYDKLLKEKKTDDSNM